MKKFLLFFMSLVSFFGYSQLPESFETSFPPTGWNTFTNGVGNVQNWGVTTNAPLVYPDGGSQSAFVNRENIGIGNTSEDWLVTPAISITATSQLRFFTRQLFSGDAGTSYQLRVSTTSPTNATSFTTVQTWNEIQLNVIYNQYEEKVVNLSAYNGQQVYIAFVRVYTQPTAITDGDAWLIDNIRLADACLDPSILTDTNNTATTVDLGWTNNGTATQWEVEILPTGGTPTGNGIIVNSNPYTALGLSPNTTYIFYVRAICGGGVTSNWIGPYNFQTLPQGLSCADPIQITTVPYTTTDNTNVYGNNIPGPQGAGCVGGGTNYLASNEVVYEFIPTFSGNVSITSTPIQNSSSLFVYSSCANIGNTCLAGVANSNNSPRQINGFAVTAGQSYFIVISSSTAAASINYNLVIQRESCAAPDNLAINNLSNTSVDLAWGNPSGAISWQVVNQPQGAGIPLGSGVVTNNNTAYAINGLTPGANYEYWVRADCNDGTFSAWSGPFLYTTTLCPPTEQCNYIFEVRDTGGNGWQGNTMRVSQNGTVVAVLTGPLASDGTNPVQVSVPLCNNQPFELYWNPNGTSAAQVEVSIIEPTANNVIYTKPAGSGSQNSLLFNGVAQCTPPTCPQPTNIVVTAVNSNSGFVNWSDNAGATQWEIIIQPLGTGYPTGSGIQTGTRPYQMLGLNSVTQYEVYVRAICSTTDSSVWSGPIAFTTTPNYCAGDNFYDTGGPSGNYPNDQESVVTICPENVGDVVSISFNSFNTQAGGDTFEIFNGGSVTSTLLGTFSGTNLPPNFTSSDASGCLTFRFTSNGATTASGWDADITCGPPPSCPAPISLSLISINDDEFTVGWNETGTATQWEVIYLPTGSTPPNAGSTGTIVNSNPATLVGVAAGFYDVYIRAICGPSNVSEWSSVPIQFYVVAGLQACAGVNIGTSNNGVIDVCSTDNCVDLSASYFETGNTSTYKVDPIAFAPPFPFTGGTPLNIDQDDRWSPIIPLPFEFCFFGNKYTQCSVGSNGVVTFDTPTSTTCPWRIDNQQQLPSPNFPNPDQPLLNSIFGVYQDIDPRLIISPQADINYQVLGSAPCRVFIFNISNVGQFSIAGNNCNSLLPLQTSQIVIYETSNVIEVYVLNRAPCTLWQNGAGVIGIQNSTGTQAHVPPGRNTGAWSAANEGWRFTPDGAPNVSFSWLKDGQFYSNDLNINVCINATTNMTAEAIYTSCDGDQTVTTQNVLLNYKQLFEPAFTPIDPICNGETFTLATTSLDGVTGTWTPAIDNTQTTEYTFTPDANQCALPTRIEVIVRDQVTPSFVDPAPICAGETAPLLPTTSNNGITGIWSPSTIDNMASGQYTFTPDSGQCGVPYVLDYTVLPACDLNIIATAVFIDNCETANDGAFFNITGSGTDLIGVSGNVFPNSNLGTYVENSGTLIFKGGELRTFKGVSSNVCVVDLKYRVYESTATPGVFTTLDLPLLDDCVAGSFPTGGTCDPGDQKWQDVSSVLDLTTLAPGNYRIEVYFEVTGDLDSPTDCNDTLLVDNNGSYYSASFSIQSSPTFTYIDPTFCNATNGSITISGFNPSAQYSVTYTDDGVVVGPTNYYANLSGQILLNGLNAGVYSDFNFSINGCNVSSTNSFTLVNPIITPTFNQIGPFCAGSTFSLPIVSNEGISGSWTPALNNTQTTVYTFVPNANQCAVNSNPYTVLINPLPFVTQVIPVDFCPGTDATFTIEGSANATLSYQIDSGATQLITLDANGLATVSVTTPTANVFLTLSLIDDNTCTNALNLTSTANILPQPNIISIIPVDPVVCKGSDATYTITGTPNAIVTYTVDGGSTQTLTLDAAGLFTLVIPSPAQNVQVVLIDITNLTTTCSRVLAGINATVAVLTVPTPTAIITQPICSVPTGTVEVMSPIFNQLNYPSDLFISEVTDAPQNNVSLTYVEIYNGTGVPVDLGAYKLRLFRDGAPTPNSELTLSGTLANDAVFIVKIGTGNNPAIVPNLSIVGFNINNNDNIRLSNLSNVDIDIWGTLDGTPFTPLNGIGYDYQRNKTGTVLPTVNWNPVDWTVVDWNTTTLPADYSDVGIYTLFVSNYEYILSDGTTSQTQTTTTYTGLVPGPYTLVAHDLVFNCFSEPFSFTINPVVFTNPITDITYTTPVCEDSANLLPDTSAVGFVTGGSFASTTGLVINVTTGEIDVVSSTAGTYTVTYSVLADVPNCINAGSSTFDIVINSITQATFDPIEDVCADSNNTELPPTSLEGYTGTWSPASINTSAAGDFTYTFTPDAQFCALPVSIIVKTENCFIQKGISPNGDEYNQFFDLSNFNVNKLEIFNRYGRKVYARVNYKKEWEGQTDSGDELPDGTYYYVIDFSDRDSKTGWIYINRQQ